MCHSIQGLGRSLIKNLRSSLRFLLCTGILIREAIALAQKTIVFGLSEVPTIDLGIWNFSPH